ncbi:MAG: DUF368 domain-containing protein [Candidatus Omnitrophica bacterium]|nr:DUF368 domain-containing protein [Candidatus Omnitrophota bacterium]
MPHPIDQRITGKEHFIIFFKGMCMGVAEIIPGISGGTIAFLLGIYQPFIQSIRSINSQFVKHLLGFRIGDALHTVAWKFLALLFAGMLLAILSLSHLLSWLIETHPTIIFSFFFGLILATGPIIARIVDKWTPAKVLVFLASGVATFFLVGMVPINTPDASWFILLCGAVAISAMILPGISGSFVLLILGKYHFILESVNQRDFVTIGVFVIGITVGILTFVRVLSWLFNKFHDMTLCVLTGFVLGSLNKIWPWKETIRTMPGRHGELIPIEQVNHWPEIYNLYFFIALMAMILGFTLAIIFNRCHKDTFRGLNNA